MQKTYYSILVQPVYNPNTHRHVITFVAALGIPSGGTKHPLCQENKITLWLNGWLNVPAKPSAPVLGDSNRQCSVANTPRGENGQSGGQYWTKTHKTFV